MTSVRNIFQILYLTVCLMLVACNLSLESTPPAETSHPISSEPETAPGAIVPERTPTTIPGENNLAGETTPDRFKLSTLTVMPEFVNPQDPQKFTPIVGEVPEETLQKIIIDLVQRTGADVQNIQEIRSEAVIWHDGSLGCPKPGDFYTQEPVEGYWVILRIEGEDYDYRASASGYFALCEGRGGVPISPPDENPPKQ